LVTPALATLDNNLSHDSGAASASGPKTAKIGSSFEIRSIRPDDEQRMIQFHKGLSERSVCMRYFESLSLRPAPPTPGWLVFASQSLSVKQFWWRSRTLRASSGS